METSFVERMHARSLVRSRFLVRGTVVAQDGGVDAILEASLYCRAGFGTDPVVTYRLVGFQLQMTSISERVIRIRIETYYERVPLGDEDLQRVHSHGMGVLPIRFNYRHLVAIDVEDVVGVAGDVDEAEPVSIK